MSQRTAVDGRPDRLEPPASLAPDARAAFLDIVNAYEPEHFRPGDAKLLARLASAHTWAERAEQNLELDGGVIEGRPSPWLSVLGQNVRAVVMLSTKLKLCPQSRAAGRTANARTGPEPFADLPLLNLG